MSDLRVRVYNVLFGDAVLLSVPDRTKTGKKVTRHALFDFGNLVKNSNKVFDPVVQDIQNELNGKPLDLFVMSHEHMDHTQGFLYAHEDLGIDLDVNYVWLTASAATDYYSQFPDAEKKKKQALAAYEDAKRMFQTLGSIPTGVAAILANNDSENTEKCVGFLRKLTTKKKTSYVYRGISLKNRHPFRDAEFSILAPEEDTSDYYGSFDPNALRMEARRLREGDTRSASAERFSIPSPGVDAGAFYGLVSAREAGIENLLAIDKANNNTSVVVMVKWKGWKLLFSGDAEERSWKEMDKQEVLEPVHFLKVSHHGSENGTPGDEILDKILPANPPDARPRFAAVSTSDQGYDSVPDDDTLDEIRERCTLRSTRDDIPAGKFYLDFTFPTP